MLLILLYYVLIKLILFITYSKIRYKDGYKKATKKSDRSEQIAAVTLDGVYIYSESVTVVRCDAYIAFWFIWFLLNDVSHDSLY